MPFVTTLMERVHKAGPCHLEVTSIQWPPTRNNIYRAGPQSRSLPLLVSVLYYCTIHKSNTKYNCLNIYILRTNDTKTNMFITKASRHIFLNVDNWYLFNIQTVGILTYGQKIYWGTSKNENNFIDFSLP